MYEDLLLEKSLSRLGKIRVPLSELELELFAI